MLQPSLRVGGVLVAAAVSLLLVAPAQTQGPARTPGLEALRETAARLIQEATKDDFAWRRLAEVTDTYGHRLSGSANHDRAVAWAVQTMRRDGLDNVRTESVMVPKWVRGRESATIVDPPEHPIAMLGLGGSIGTPPEGIEAEVVVVNSFEELRTRATDVRGRIVLFNAPFTTYSDSVTYRTGSARAASQLGAVATLVRSIGPPGLRTPHTGSVQYGGGSIPIPAAAVSTEDADRMARLAARGVTVRVQLTMEGRSEGEVPSANVVGEIRGRERPEEIVLLGGHFDSWDVGTGASDDAVGCIVTWEAARLMAKLGIRPRRTVRVVLWTNEENGLRGANAYAAKHAAHAGDHVFALESDSGVFEPAGLGFSGSAAARGIVRDIGASLLAPLGFGDVVAGGGGADIGPISQAGNVPMMAYLGNPTRYFALHHSAADTVERITPQEVSKAAAAIAVIAYAVAEMPERLPK